MKEKNSALLTVAVVVIVAVVAAYFGFMMATRPAYSPSTGSSSGTGITVTGTYLPIGANGNVVWIDMNGDGKEDSAVSLDSSLMGQFGYMSLSGEWVSIMPSGTKVKFEDCVLNTLGKYVCKSKSVGSGAYSADSVADVVGE